MKPRVPVLVLAVLLALSAALTGLLWQVDQRHGETWPGGDTAAGSTPIADVGGERQAALGGWC